MSSLRDCISEFNIIHCKLTASKSGQFCFGGKKKLKNPFLIWRIWTDQWGLTFRTLAIWDTQLTQFTIQSY